MENKFVNGLFFRKPHPKAPTYIIGKLSAKRDDLIAFLQSQEGDWVNMEIKESAKGNLYIALDEFKPRSDAPQSPRTNESTQGIHNTAGEQISLSDVPF